MNFLEAVKALKDGKCEKIGLSDLKFILNDNHLELDFKRIREDNSRGYMGLFGENYLSDKWELINPILEYEERIVTCYNMYSYNGDFVCSYIHKEQLERFKDNSNFHIVELKGTFKVPIKEKVKKKVELKMNGIGSTVIDGINIPNNAKITAEWEE